MGFPLEPGVIALFELRLVKMELVRRSAIVEANSSQPPILG